MWAVHCTFGYFGSGYSCNITRQRVSSELTGLNGAHELGMSNNNVTKLHITECDMPELPLSLQELFPNLEGLWVSYCTLESIDNEHIGKWKNLREIYVDGCKLKYLRASTFSGLTELENISFERNLLVEIEPDILDGLKKLKSVDFLKNPNINMSVGRNELGKIKEAIKLKCKPEQSSADESEVYEHDHKVRNLELQVQHLLAENAALKYSQQKQQENHHKQLANDSMKLKKLQAAFADEAFKDFTISIDNATFKVHKVVFAAHSQTLAELFRNNPQVQELNLSDISVSTFKAVYDFIYADQLPIIANFFDIFAAAARLKIDELKEAAAKHLLIYIDADNCLEVLELGNKFEHEELRTKAFECIRTKVFPHRKLDDELAREPEKLKKLIEMKHMMDEEFANL